MKVKMEWCLNYWDSGGYQNSCSGMFFLVSEFCTADSGMFFLVSEFCTEDCYLLVFGMCFVFSDYDHQSSIWVLRGLIFIIIRSHGDTSNESVLVPNPWAIYHFLLPSFDFWVLFYGNLAIIHFICAIHVLCTNSLVFFDRYIFF